MSLHSKFADLIKNTEACMINNHACKNKKFNNIDKDPLDKDSTVLELEVTYYDDNERLQADEYHITVDMINNAEIVSDHFAIDYHGKLIKVELLWADPKGNQHDTSKYELLSTFPLSSYKD